MLLPPLLNSHYPRFVALALGPHQNVHFFHFIAAKKKARRQCLLTNTAPGVTAAVNNKVARWTTLLAQANADP